MIFFSGIESEGNIVEAIDSAIDGRLCAYAYRLPGELFSTFGSSEGVVRGLDDPGFVIALFDPDVAYITIPFKAVSGQKSHNEGILFPFPEISTSKREYSNEVSEIIRRLKWKPEEKIVAARVEITDIMESPGEKFEALCKNYPDAFVFFFSTPLTGCWLGASPELLLKSKNGIISSLSLAGTRTSDSEDSWDEKNIKEQEIVTSYICNIFKNEGLDFKVASPQTRIAGKIEHLATEITSVLPFCEKVNLNVEGKCGEKDSEIERDGEISTEKLSSLLHKLAPTPALSGFPKNPAIEFIKNHESFSRGCYGGFCGPFFSSENFIFHVNLRCGFIRDKKIALFAGGGITELSDPEKEWEETEAKLSTMKKL